ncbi:MAG TPA: hypothetical protein QF517_10705 [Pseudomonadales bacterium]|nr:hypothetical protein [Gammaproteobacteria bacterium]MDP6026567.1 hypothetical protein [Pseudomonadales bacterium]MDP6317135.1 hypothetical protein [Pseudomonadales bacterium]MDP7314888.1 hypothetical protein [Pseudomonadales bacterium]HJL62420.1 hypothetical protein [Pseudomonadales bacterium]
MIKPKAEVDIPLLILPHDFASNGSKIIEASRIEQFTIERGFAVLAPNADGFSFNDGSGLQNSVDDVAFIDELIRLRK